MASSVARMPGDDWPGFFSGSRGKHLKKIHLPKLSIQPPNQPQFYHHHHSPKSKSKPKPNSNSTSGEPDHDSEFVSTPSKRHQHSQKILDRWAAHQAREMVTTIERQAHEAEISELSSTTQPVSARARRFSHRREPSPTPSDMSTCSAPAVAYGDVPQTVRASSLIQMWRDLEASTPRGIPKMDNGGWGDETEIMTAKGMMVRPAIRGRGEIEELVARMEAERRREVAWIADRRVVSQFPNRGRLQSILRLKFLRREIPAQEKTCSPSSKAKFEKSCRSPKKIPTRQCFESEAPRCIKAPAATDESGTNSTVDQTVESTAESSQKLEFAEDTTQSNLVHHSSDTLGFEGKNKDENHYQENLAPTNSSASNNGYYENDDHIIDVPATNNNHYQEYPHPPADLIVENNHQLECPHPTADLTVDSITSQISCQDNPADAATDSFPDNILSGLNSPCSDEQQDCQDSRFQSLESSWDERNLWLGSVDWQRSAESTTPNSWSGDVLPVEELGAIPWSCDSPNSWRALIYQGTSENISENTDIHDLLQRKRVTTSLRSDFCTKMNRLILSVLQRQDQYNVDDNFGEEYTMRPYWRQKYELNNSEKIPTDSSSLVPFQYHNNSGNWQNTTFTNNVLDNSVDVESMAQIRTDMSQIRDEISELRRLVESCMQWQCKLHESIKLKVSNAVSQAVSVAGPSIANGTSSASEMKAKCVICNGAHVDSLLYRCGHMCACFKCARDLQLNGHKCPTCRSSIEDVVQVNPSS